MKLTQILATILSAIIKIAVAIWIVNFLYTKTLAAYDFGYRIFTEAPIAPSPGRDVVVSYTEGKSFKDLAKTLEESFKCHIKIHKRLVCSTLCNLICKRKLLLLDSIEPLSDFSAVRLLAILVHPFPLGQPPIVSQSRTPESLAEVGLLLVVWLQLYSVRN